MSGVASVIGKVFSTVGTAATRVASSVAGVGANVFTAGAATGAGSMASGGLSGVVQSVAGNGVLGNVLSGAIKQAGYGAVIGAAGAALTGNDPMKGAMAGGVGGALTGGLSSFVQAPGAGAMSTAGAGGVPSPQAKPSFGNAVAPAATPTGMAPAGTGGSGSSLLQGGLGKILQSPLAGNVIAGIGGGLAQGMQMKELMAEKQRQRDWETAQQQRVTDSYWVSDSAYRPEGGGPSDTAASIAALIKRRRYDPDLKRIVEE